MALPTRLRVLPFLLLLPSCASVGNLWPWSGPTVRDHHLLVVSSQGASEDVLSEYGDSAQIQIIDYGSGSHGVVSLDKKRLLFVPEPDYYGTDKFSFRVQDGAGWTKKGIVFVAVQPPSLNAFQVTFYPDSVGKAKSDGFRIRIYDDAAILVDSIFGRDSNWESGVPVRMQKKLAKEVFFSDLNKMRMEILPISSAKSKEWRMPVDVIGFRPDGVEEELTASSGVTTDSTYTRRWTFRSVKGYAPLPLLDSNFVIFSAIHSFLGKQAPSELTDLNFKFTYNNWSFSYLAIDLNLTDTLHSFGQAFRDIFRGEVGASYNIGLPGWRSADDRRQFFAGGVFKVFNQTPFIGVHLGSIEVAGPLFSSYFNIGYLWRLYPEDKFFPQEFDTLPQQFDSSKNPLPRTVTPQPLTLKAWPHNFYAEFAIHAEGLSIFENLRLKATVMFPSPFTKPYDGDREVQARFLLELPIGGIFKFF